MTKVDSTPTDTEIYRQQVDAAAASLQSHFKDHLKGVTVCLILGSGLNKLPKNEKRFKVIAVCCHYNIEYPHVCRG